MSNDKDFTMNGPANFEMIVWVINEDKEQKAKVTYSLGSFEFPTVDKIQTALKELKFEGALEGFRLMSKRETFKAFMLEKTGEEFAMIGDEEWDLPNK